MGKVFKPRIENWNQKRLANENGFLRIISATFLNLKKLTWKLNNTVQYNKTVMGINTSQLFLF